MTEGVKVRDGSQDSSIITGASYITGADFYKYGLKVVHLPNFAGEKSIQLPRDGDVGIDLYSAEDIYIPLGGIALIPTGIKIELAEYWWLNIRDRSSVSKYCHVLAGVVDSSYRGEIMVRMFCVAPSAEGFNGYQVKKGAKIAQMIICRNYNSEFKIESCTEGQLTSTDRGTGGFGSTGG